MLKSKIKQKRGTINVELVQRIDKINDDKEFSPYDPMKRTHVSQEDLFNEDDYEHQEGDFVELAEKRKKPIVGKILRFIGGAIITITVIAMIGGVIWIFYTMLNSV